MKAAQQKVNSIVRDTQLMSGDRSSDTIRLWENYRDQATLWRSLALLQIPTTLVAVIFCLILWNTRKITLDVPRQPLPGQYSASEIPTEKFIEAATDYINLVATYTPATARVQFKKAREMLIEPLLSRFDIEMMGIELKAIENTSRTQIFFADPTKIDTLRSPNSKEVKVQIDGSRFKLVGGQELPLSASRFIVTLTTVPRNVLNPYGIVVENVEFASVDPDDKK